MENIELDVDFIYFGYRFKIKSSRKSVKMNMFTLDNRYSFLSCTTYAANQTVHATLLLGLTLFSSPSVPQSRKKGLVTARAKNAECHRWCFINYTLQQIVFLTRFLSFHQSGSMS